RPAERMGRKPSCPPIIGWGQLRRSNMKRFPAALALFAAVILPAGALAQTTWLEIEDDALTVAPLNLTVDQIEDMDVYTAGGEKVGEVEEVLGMTQTAATALAVEVGQFLDVDDRDVIIRLDQITVQDDRLVIDMTKEQLATFEEWDD